MAPLKPIIILVSVVLLFFVFVLSCFLAILRFSYSFPYHPLLGEVGNPHINTLSEEQLSTTVAHGMTVPQACDIFHNGLVLKPFSGHGDHQRLRKLFD